VSDVKALHTSKAIDVLPHTCKNKQEIVTKNNKEKVAAQSA
jgi:hypothetical protein